MELGQIWPLEFEVVKNHILSTAQFWSDRGIYSVDLDTLIAVRVACSVMRNWFLRIWG